MPKIWGETLTYYTCHTCGPQVTKVDWKASYVAQIVRFTGMLAFRADAI
jgi:hypothetical protein